LIALAGMAGAAAAQQPAAQQPAAAPAAQAAAPGMSPTPAPPAGSTASAPQAAVDPAANPTLPTTGDGAQVLSILQRVCIPAVKGGAMDQLAKSVGMKKDRRSGGYAMTLGADRNYTLTIPPQGSNKNVCQMDLRYALNGERPIITALNIWSFLQSPELKLQRNDFQVGGDGVKRITMSWEYYNDRESTGLVFVQQKNADGSAMNARYDSGTVLYSERKFQ
jgi:hypothetical protein